MFNMYMLILIPVADLSCRRNPSRFAAFLPYFICRFRIDNQAPVVIF